MAVPARNIDIISPIGDPITRIESEQVRMALPIKPLKDNNSNFRFYPKSSLLPVVQPKLATYSI